MERPAKTRQTLFVALFAASFVVCSGRACPNSQAADIAAKLSGKEVFVKGEDLLQAERYDEAAESFCDYLERWPNGRLAASALFRAGECEYLSGNTDEAKPFLKRFLREHSKSKLSAYALAYSGEMAIAEKDDDSAERYFRAALQQFPKSDIAETCRLGLATVLLEKKQFGEAGRLLTQVATGKDPMTAFEARLRLSAMLERTGNYAEALVSYNDLKRRAKSSRHRVLAQLGAARTLLNLDWPEQAKEIFEEIASDANVGVEANYRLGTMAMENQDWSGAARYFDTVITRRPESRFAEESIVERARVAVEANDHKTVFRMVEMLSERFPGSKFEDDIRCILAFSIAHEDQRICQNRQQPEPPVELTPIRRSEIPEPDKLVHDPDLPVPLVAMPKQLKSPPPVRELAPSRIELPKRSAAVEQIDPELAALIKAGRSHLDSRQWHQAVETFAGVLDNDCPREIAAEAALDMGEALEKLGRLDAALAMFDRVVEDYADASEHPSALLAAARLRDRLDQDREAELLYRRLTKVYPDSPQAGEASYRLALIVQGRGQRSHAKALFEQARRSGRNIHEADVSPAYGKNADGTTEAVADSSNFSADATYRLAREAFVKKDYRRADELAAEAPAGRLVDVGRDEAMHLGGRIAVARRDWAEAVRRFEKLIEQFPQSGFEIEARFWIAEADFRLGNYELAGKQLDRLARLSLGRGGAWPAMTDLRRRVAAHGGNWAKAYEISRAMSKRYPDFEQAYEVHYLIGCCLAKRGDYETARETLGRVVESSAAATTETAAMARWLIGETHFAEGKYKSALKEYAQLASRGDFPRWQAAALLKAGECHEKLGDLAEARKVYGRLVDNFPGTEFARRAAGRLRIASKPNGIE